MFYSRFRTRSKLTPPTQLADSDERNDDVLSVAATNSGSEFSGFSPQSPLNDSDNPRTPVLRSKVVKKKKTVEKKKSKEKDGKKSEKPKHRQKQTDHDKENSKSGASESLFSKLTEKDIANLRGLLGIQPTAQEPELEAEEWTDEFDPEWQNPLPLRVQFNPEDLSGDEPEQGEITMKQGFRNALGTGKEDDWGLPKDITKEKGKPVSASLAKMVNLACTTPCDVQGLLSDNKVPENCDKACPPLVNPEVWKVMDRKSRSQDRILFDIQSLVAGAISPVTKLAEMLKSEISENTEVKSLLSDALTCLGQTQYKLSIRRRYAIRPALKSKYASLCNMNMPVTNQLFGDDIGKEIKACESFSYIGKEQNFSRAPQFRGRGYSRYPRRTYHQYGATGYGQGNGGYGHGTGYVQRYQPYPPRGQPPVRGSLRGYHIPKKTVPSATVSAPNEKA